MGLTPHTKKTAVHYTTHRYSLRSGPSLINGSYYANTSERIHDHHMSWGQWFTDSEVPGVLWNKWLERRRMMHQIKRWNLDHSEELQTAWMNGSGILGRRTQAPAGLK
jgi:hypothetical protein